MNHNGKRSSRLSFLAKKNINLSRQIKEHLQTNTMKKENKEALIKLSGYLGKCANVSLYRKGEKFTYIGSHTCNNRNCNVCNWQRQKAIRRKYLSFFQSNKELYLIQNLKTTKKKIVTKSVFEKTKEDFSFVGVREYDLMHLTLTVPHTKESGYKGEKYYFSQIISDFNKLRKRKDWSLWVYGGEYGVETTTGESGLHTHIHSLVFVRKARQNRNELHKIILKEWNEITKTSDIKEISENRLKPIIKSNSLLNIDFAKNLFSTGATSIGLGTIFTVQEGKKTRSNEFGSDAMLKAVMETISYHFEPQAFDKELNHFNIELLGELLPKIRKQKLYGRFGCLEHEKSLMISDNSDVSKEYAETKEILIDTDTGEILEDEFYIVQPSRVWHDVENDFDIKIHKSVLNKSLKLNAFSTLSALELIKNIVKNEIQD